MGIIEGAKPKDEINANKSIKIMTQQGNIYDTFVKSFFCMLVVMMDFLRNYGDREFLSRIDLEKIQPAPTHYIGADEREKILDLLFYCPLRDGDGNLTAIIIFEHQSDDLKYVPLKLHKYAAAIWDEEMRNRKTVLSAPYFIVLRAGTKPHVGPYPTIMDLLPKTKEGKPIGKLVSIEYDVIDLPAWDFDQLVGGPELRLVLGVVKKMTEEDFEDFAEAFKPLSELGEGQYKIDLTKKAIIFIDRAMQSHNRRLDAEKVRQALHYAFPEYENERNENMIVSLFEEKYLAGEAKGRAEGKAEGKAEGEAKGKAETIFLFLASRFDGVSKELEKKVQKITNIEKLNELAKFAAKCESLSEFERALNS